MRDIEDFTSLKIKLASPDDIHAWSYGEVRKPETINYRTLRPERDGLFCERIFGTTKDWECYCGKFKSIRYKGVICDRCGVEVTNSKVRRERIGHIDLASPVSHIWYYHSVPSRLGLLLNLNVGSLRSVLYYEKYIVLDPGDTDLKKYQLLTEDEYNAAREAHGLSFSAGMGAEAIRTLLEGLDLDALAGTLRAQMAAKGEKSDRRLLKRIEIVDDFRRSGNKPSWMILDVIPVIPPDLRPMVQLDGGRFATSDLNDLYRRVINRNNRLRRLLALDAPDIIIRNERRMLQEAVDSLFDNSKRRRQVSKGASNRPLKSLSDMLRGKQGRFRQNLLGKRVDYSGRSVIVVGPELKLWQCGVPEEMALELFKPFLMKRLVDRQVVFNIRRARTMVENGAPEVYAVLDEVVREHPVMLNRAPTLHRLGIQAFEPVLVSGKALKLHPLVCRAFNADFDGDQMAIHIPLTAAAQMECWTLMLSSRNLLDPANGSMIVGPSQDMVLGIYYMTSIKPHAKGEGRLFSSADEVRLAAESGAIEWQAEIRIHKNTLGKCVHNDPDPDGRYILTSAGRMAFNEAMGDAIDFYNEQLDDKALKQMIEAVYHIRQTSDLAVKALIAASDGEGMDAIVNRVLSDEVLRGKINALFNRVRPLSDGDLTRYIPTLYAPDRAWLTVGLLDAIKDCGYRNATFYGATISMDDILIPAEKETIVEDANREVEKIVGQWNSGAITADERYNKSVAVWEAASDRLTDIMMDTLSRDKDGFNTIYMMAKSGARGSKKQISQLAAMRGLMQKPNGDIIELPIRANFKEGLSVIEYFISTNGARKGLSDTALKTADAGYMTRRLVDVSQDVVVEEDDCGTINGMDYTAIKDGDTVLVPLSSRIEGHFAIERVVDPVTGDLLCDVNQYIDEALAARIEAAGCESVKVRTVLTCESKHGICVKCYGKDLARNKIVEIGEAVGTIAAQSIGQPGTQLTLRTFHTGGAAEGGQRDNRIVLSDSVYIEDLTGAHVVQQNGDWLFTRRGAMTVAKLFDTYTVKEGDKLLVSDGSRVRKGTPLIERSSADILPLESDQSRKEAGAFPAPAEDSAAGQNLPLLQDTGVITASDSARVVVKDDKLYLIGSDRKVNIVNGSRLFAAYTAFPIAANGGEPLGEFDPYSEPIIAEEDGYVHYEDIIDGETLEVRTDVQTGAVERRISGAYTDVRQPRMLITDEDGNEIISYHLPAGSVLAAGCEDGGHVDKGTVLARIAAQHTQASDITLGLPRVSELFEARIPKNPAVIAKISGVVKFGRVSKNKRNIIVEDEYGTDYNHLVPIAKRLLVRDGDRVEAGEILSDGAIDPHDVLSVLGENELQNYLMNEIQAVYRAQGVDINDKHIGIIVRQMLKRVEVIDVGDTNFIYGQQVDKYAFREENERVIAEGGQPAIARPMFQGITKAALASDSFVSACSFQETTRVLTSAAIAGATDNLHGLKENIIIGHRIPAGTGIRYYSNIKLSDKTSEDLDAKMKEILEQRALEIKAEQEAAGIPAFEGRRDDD